MLLALDGTPVTLARLKALDGAAAARRPRDAGHPARRRTASRCGCDCRRRASGSKFPAPGALARARALLLEARRLIAGWPSRSTTGRRWRRICDTAWLPARGGRRPRARASRAGACGCWRRGPTPFAAFAASRARRGAGPPARDLRARCRASDAGAPLWRVEARDDARTAASLVEEAHDFLLAAEDGGDGLRPRGGRAPRQRRAAAARRRGVGVRLRRRRFPTHAAWRPPAAWPRRAHARDRGPARSCRCSSARHVVR